MSYKLDNDFFRQDASKVTHFDSQSGSGVWFFFKQGLIEGFGFWSRREKIVCFMSLDLRVSGNWVFFWNENHCDDND